MLVTQRQELIVTRAKERGFVRVAELAAELDVTGMTIRRDLDDLVERGLLRRIRGGAVPVTESGGAGGDPGHPVHRSNGHIGIVLPDMASGATAEASGAQAGGSSLVYYFGRVLAGARHEIERTGGRASLMLLSRSGSSVGEATEAEIAEERRAVEELAGRVDGILFTPNVHLTADVREYVAWLEGLGVPVVLMEREIPLKTASRNISSVRSAHGHGVGAAIDEFLEHGHARIALLAHQPSQTATWIREGWAEATADRGIAGAVTGIGELVGWPAPSAVGSYVDGLLADGVTGLLCHNDNNAYAVLLALKARGVRVPEDFSLIGYDDDYAAMFDPPVTSVAPSRRYVGVLAARLLLDRIEFGEESAASHVQVEPQLIIRESVAVPAGASPMTHE